MISSLNCLFGLHEYTTLVEDNKYVVKHCKVCKNYNVKYKQHDIKNNFKYEELPENIINKIKYKSQV